VAEFAVTTPVKISFWSGRRLLSNLLIYCGLPVILIVGWQLASSAGVIESYLLPSPLATVEGFYEVLSDGSLATNLWASLVRSISGFVIATVIAVPLGILIGWFKLFRKVTHVTLLILIPIPITAWISIAILWFGLGDRSAIFLVALGAAVPILINTMHGVEWVDKIYVEAARTLGTRQHELLWRIILPVALPSIFTGMRLGLRNSWAGLVVAEMIGAKSGIGYMIWDARLMMRSDLLITGMLLVGVLGSISDQIMAFIAKYVLRWHESAGGQDG
jgi:ABC-type nitrate/sulfonate/bicarbonate transport system permease component